MRRSCYSPHLFRLVTNVNNESAMCDLNSISLQKVQLWSLQALKLFLSIRKKSVKGSFDELVARVFAAQEEDVPVDQDAVCAERVLLTEYKQKMLQDGEVYPDPFSITNGWQGEQERRYMWPSIFITDISDYLKRTAVDDVSLVRRLLNEYKEGKAYRYYTCERVRELKYHPVRPSSPYCYLSANVFASMRMKTSYIVWVMVTSKKEGSTGGGGEIKEAFCSCPAGLLGSCNHIAGVLFRVEAAVKIGATQRTGTEVSCQWAVPKGPVSRKPQAVQDTVLAKDRYGRQSRREHQRRSQQLKQEFVPFSEAQAAELQEDDKLRADLEGLLGNVVPECVFMRTRKRLPPAVPRLVCPTLAAGLIQIGQKCSSLQHLKKELCITQEEVDTLERSTREQSASGIWRQQRLGRITSSKFYSVYTRATTLLRRDVLEEDRGALASAVMNFTAINTEATKLGIALEPAAKEVVKEVLKKKHEGCRFRDSGLVVSQEFPYLAANPDLIVNCECCQQFLVEIECPFSIAHTSPCVDNLQYNKQDSCTGVVSLKEKHGYYGQIQGQLAIAGGSFCELFVFTLHGHMLVRVEEFVVLIMKTLVEHLPAFKAFHKCLFDTTRMPAVPNLDKKQVVVPLAVLPTNEQKYSEVVDVLDYYESFLEELNAEAGLLQQHSTKVHIGGDQLTRERFSGAKRLRCTDETPAKRFEHLHPITFELFHLQMKLLSTYKEKSLETRHPWSKK